MVAAAKPAGMYSRHIGEITSIFEAGGSISFYMHHRFDISLNLYTQINRGNLRFGLWAT